MVAAGLKGQPEAWPVASVPEEAGRSAVLPVSVVQLAMAVGVAAFLREVPLPFEHLGRGDHRLVAAGILLERGSGARFAGHGVHSFPDGPCVYMALTREQVNADPDREPAGRVPRAVRLLARIEQGRNSLCGLGVTGRSLSDGPARSALENAHGKPPSCWQPIRT
jgi:hypothetical protein